MEAPLVFEVNDDDLVALSFSSPRLLNEFGLEEISFDERCCIAEFAQLADFEGVVGFTSCILGLGPLASSKRSGLLLLNLCCSFGVGFGED